MRFILECSPERPIFNLTKGKYFSSSYTKGVPLDSVIQETNFVPDSVNSDIE